MVSACCWNWVKMAFILPIPDKLNKNEDMLLIDVREHGEYENGHIKGAHMIPRGILEAAADPAYPKHLPELTAARDRQVVVYCATSGRSAMVAAVLQIMGFKNVLNMAGFALCETDFLFVRIDSRIHVPI
jgi:rhodanese-related sulfurtransferase